MITEVLESPIFFVPVFYVVTILFLIKFLVVVLSFMSENVDRYEISINSIIIDDHIRLFAEFVITTFSTLVSIYIYGCLKNMIENTYFFVRNSSIIQLSCIIMAIIIRIFVTKIIKFKDRELEEYIRTSDEISSLRLLGSIFAIFHLVYFNCYLGKNEYEELLISYIILVIGRFLFFDSSLWGFWKEIRRMLKYIWMLLVMIILFYLPIYFLLKDYIMTSLNDILLSVCIVYVSILLGIYHYIDTINPIFGDI